MMDSTDLDDSHLCIKCNATIVGLEKYIEHRKHNCGNGSSNNANNEKQGQGSDMSADVVPTGASAATIPTTMIVRTGSNSLHHSYDNFTFAEPEAPSSYVNKTEHGGKTAKNLTDAYDLTYELGADVFFSSLQLQSVQSSGPSTSGKTSSSSGHGPITRQKSQSENVEDHQHQVDESWISQHTSGTDTLLKAISYISDAKKHYDSDYKTMKLAQIVTDITSDEEEEDDEEGVEFENDDDDADYDPRVDALAMGVKWKLSPMRHSPPTVPATHTGGKWKPEHRPTLPVTHMSRLSPNWDEQADDLETAVETEAETHNQHPPAEHTKGKWVPGSKVQRLEYRENVDLTVSMNKQAYWCNICCRKLKNKIIYDQHLRTSYHIKRAEPEQLLEKATLNVRPQDTLTVDDNFTATEQTSTSSARPEDEGQLKKRKRRAIFIRCELCKHIMQRHQIGKHLISHYHYRRMQVQRKKPALLHMILDNMPTIVLQSPYQCRPCSFYANTEEAFAQHWLSEAHSQKIQGPGKFWCNYCQFECLTNEQMYDHLLAPQHKEVILLINRSVPICINKRLIIDCSVCGAIFRYNAELRQHFATAHASTIPTGGASDVYQSRFMCNYCGELQRSRIALQRHEKFKHSVRKYHCGICKLEFSTATKAMRHRKSMPHKRKAAADKMQSKKLMHRKVPAKLKEDTAHMEKILHEILADPATDVVKDLQDANIEKPPDKDVVFDSLKKPNKSIGCQRCALVFENKEGLKKHQIMEHSVEQHECMLCNQSFLSAQALGRHTRCCQPKASTSAAAAAAANEQSTQVVDNLSQKLWNCAECTFSAAYESDLIYHTMLHTNRSLGRDQLLKCPLCPKSFRKHSLRCHLRQHTNEKIFECEICQLKFARRGNLKNHLTTMHSENLKTPKAKPVRKPKIKTEKEEQAQAFICNVCGKELASKYTLKLHTMNHTQTERRFLCSHEGCQYAGSTQHILNIHLASHSQQSFTCDYEHCSYVGKSSMHLKRHQQSHTKRSKALKCDQCDFKTAVRSHLNRHLACHTGQKPHHCPYCDFRCNGFDNLRKHILKTGKHPGKFMYECELCNQSQTKQHFNTNSFVDYQNHITNVHGTNDIRNLN